MPTKRFLIHYPDGTREQVPTAEKEHLLLAGELRAIDANRFEFIGQRKTMIFRSFRELERIAQLLNVTPAQLKRYLAGHFVWEIDEQRLKELMETPEAMSLRLDNPSGPCCKFNPNYARQEFERRQRGGAEGFAA
jgi:hypothetical protein